MKLIIRKDRIFTHIGIYWDNTKVFHFSSLTNNFFRNDKTVKCNTLIQFSRNRKVKLINCEARICMDDFMRAIEGFKEKQADYHIIKNNCYTFVLWCLYGQSQTTVRDILQFAYRNNIPIFSFGIWHT